jgi:hypothetical protein
VTSSRQRARFLGGKEFQRRRSVATSGGYNTVATPMIRALVVAIGIDAQGPFVQSATSSTQVMSPTVVASWYVEREPNQPNRLQLVVLWRGASASMPSARFTAAAAEDMQNRPL